jgi:glycosyltransferase involved in cell wall biosynthesis
MLEGFAIAHKQNQNLRMIIAGGSASQVKHYQDMVKKLGIDKFCTLTGRVPQPVAKKLMEKATVLASPRIEGNNTPLKVYELLASGKPMFATNIYSHTQVLTDDVAFMVDPTAEGIAQGMLDSTANNDTVVEKIRNARKLYDEKYSRKVYEAKMRKLLDRLACAE